MSNFTRISLLLLLLPLATADAAPRRISGDGFTIAAAEGWEDKTAGAELSLRNGDKQLRAALVPMLFERVAKAVKSDAECKSLGAEVAGTLGAEGAKSAKRTVAKRATCESIGTVAGNNHLLAILLPVGKSATIVFCIGPATSASWQDECRTMAASVAIDAKAKAAVATSGVTTKKLASGGMRVAAPELQLDLPAGWERRASTSDQVFAALKDGAIVSLSQFARRFKGDTEANCKKLGASMASSMKAKGEGQIIELAVGKVCMVSLDHDKGMSLSVYINGPGPEEHWLFSCMTSAKDVVPFRECGVALSTLVFTK